MIRIIVGDAEPLVVSNDGLRDFGVVLAYLMRFSSELMSHWMPSDGRGANADSATRAYVVGRNLLSRVDSEIARQDAPPPVAPVSVKARRG